MKNRECVSCIKRKTPYCPTSMECMDTEDMPYYRNRMMLLKENQELKQKLNWIAFGDDAELALRYLRKIGYVDFDEERKVYINKHNNEPFALDEEEEKAYYIKSEELNEYTKQLEYQNKELKKQVEETDRKLFFTKNELDMRQKSIDNKLNQQKEFIKYLEDEIKSCELICDLIFNRNKEMKIYKEILQKYKKIIGGKKDESK